MRLPARDVVVEATSGIPRDSVGVNVVCAAREPNGYAEEAAPVDASGAPVFPTAQLSDVQAYQRVDGPTVFVYVTVATDPGRSVAGSKPSHGEFEVAHVRIYDRTGDYSYDYRYFTFYSGDGEKAPLDFPDGTTAFGPALRSGVLHPGQRVDGYVVFDVPPGGGDVDLGNVLPEEPPTGIMYSVKVEMASPSEPRVRLSASMPPLESPAVVAGPVVPIVSWHVAT